jgi:hypothetical protein
MIAIPIPFWVAIAIVVLGCLAWLVELPQRQRKREAERQARLQLAKDLQRPKPSEHLPYGSPLPQERSTPSAPESRPEASYGVATTDDAPGHGTPPY